MRPNDCAWTRRTLPFHLEGETSPADSLRVASHLAACAACRSREGEERKLLSGVRNLAPQEPPRDIAGGVLAALRAMRRASAPRALKWSALGLAAALLSVPGLRPWELSAFAWKLLVRMGEIIDAEEILARLAAFVPKFLASPMPFIDALVSGQPPGGSGAGLHAFGLASPLLAILAATFLAAICSGCAMLGGYLLARERRG